MTNYKIYITSLVILFLYSTYGDADLKEINKNVTSTDDQKVKIEEITNKSLQQEDKNGKQKADTKDGPIAMVSQPASKILEHNIDSENETLYAETGNKKNITRIGDMKTQIEEVLHLKISNNSLQNTDNEKKYDNISSVKYANSHNIDTENQTIIIQTANQPSPVREERIDMQNQNDGSRREDKPMEIKLIHEELREEPKKDNKFEYFTKPMQPDTTAKPVQSIALNLLNNLLNKNEKKNIINETGDEAIKELNQYHNIIIQDNLDKENQIQKLEAENEQLLNRIRESMDLDNQKFLRSVENFTERTKENVLTTEPVLGPEKPPQNVLTIVNSARKAAKKQRPVNVFSPEEMNGYADVMAFGNNMFRTAMEYSTKDLEKEKQRKKEHRDKVETNLKTWLKDREMFHKSTVKKFKEKCLAWGTSTDKAKNLIIRPCCNLCCRRSDMGCK